MLIIAIMFWGIAIAPTKWALYSFPPFTLLFLRLSLAGCLFFPFHWKEIRQTYIPWNRMILLSFTGVAGYFMFTSYGISLTSGMHVSIIDATLPLFTIMFSAFFLQEKINWKYWVGMFLGMCGVLLITIPLNEQESTSSPMGDLLILASTVLFAFYNILLKQPKEEADLSSGAFTTLTLLAGAIIVLPFTIFEVSYRGIPDVITWQAWGSLAYLIIGPTILAYLLWNKALEEVSAAVGGMYLNILPLVSMIASVILLDEVITWRIVVGGGLVLLAIIWADQEKFKMLFQSVLSISK
ncbi:DMT family transporter [Bacillus sp. 3103sda1]|uniref:DMT family transporter n=1 Tax=Bacillus sp. 3103sda1 TaxID=2953808 RepID=UPI00209E7A05|nr:EamA family transporter [Bacillus sp. 3103sda1]MCP1122067.1 DMT family transporter [Bacillus sp. 3103sda1]